MSRSMKTPALAAAIGGSLILAGGTFAATPLVKGYMLGADAAAAADKAKEGGCGGKHAEGGCGMARMDTDKDGRISRAEFAAAHKGDDSRFAAHDADGDGFVSSEEMKAHHEAPHDAGNAEKPAAKMAEGKCGEGKCGGNM